MFSGLSLIEHIVKKLEDDDVRVYDHNIVMRISKMSNAELVELLRFYKNEHQEHEGPNNSALRCATKE